MEGPGLPSGSIIYQGHLFPKKDTYGGGWVGATAPLFVDLDFKKRLAQVEHSTACGLKTFFA